MNTLSFRFVYKIILVFYIFSCRGIPDPIISKENPTINKTRKAVLLSAFFGLDNSLPFQARGIWMEAEGKDGMPLVFSHEIDPTSLDKKHFKIKSNKGIIYFPSFVTFKPAIEEFELRTILLIGEFGNFPDNEPIDVEIVGDLQSREGQNLKGQHIKVTALKEGPSISYAEYFTLNEDYPYVESGRGSDCQKQDTFQVVRIVWEGGVRALNGEELSSRELSKVTVKLINGKEIINVHPFQFADLNDFDNNLDLCIKEKGTPVEVFVEANTVIDPNKDKNPYSKKAILSRW